MNHPAFDHLLNEHRALLAHYGRAQLRCSQALTAQAREIERLQAEAIRLRGRLIRRETELAYARQDQARLAEGLQGLPRRRTLARQLETLAGRLQERARDVLHWQWRAASAAAAAAGNSPGLGLQSALAGAAEGSADDMPAASPWRSVLCIAPGNAGGWIAQRMVPGPDGLAPEAPAAPVAAPATHVFQEEGGDVDADALEASLTAADLVICQTGCLSHNDYWRVQDHCKRTGKACVMVADTPQVIHWMRGVRAGADSSTDAHSLA